MFSLLGGRVLGAWRLRGGTALPPRAVSAVASLLCNPTAWGASTSPSVGGWRGHKTVSSVKKRVRITGSGNLKRGQAGMRHGTGPKPRSRLRSLGQTRLIQGKQKKKIMWMLGSG